MSCLRRNQKSTVVVRCFCYCGCGTGTLELSSKKVWFCNWYQNQAVKISIVSENVKLKTALDPMQRAAGKAVQESRSGRGLFHGRGWMVSIAQEKKQSDELCLFVKNRQRQGGYPLTWWIFKA